LSIMPSLSFCGIVVIVLLETSIEFARGQWNPNDPIHSDPQWVKPRQKRTSGADEPWPPWLPPECPPDLPSYCMLPPYYPYDVVRREIPNIGIVLGRSMAYKPHRYINLFLGVPYAKPPVYERRFQVCTLNYYYAFVTCIHSFNSHFRHKLWLAGVPLPSFSISSHPYPERPHRTGWKFVCTGYVGLYPAHV